MPFISLLVQDVKSVILVRRNTRIEEHLGENKKSHIFTPPKKSRKS